ncbi:hypothetical protein ACWEOE_01880 [Amycolatopsis sp. NPDC004368]
MAEPFASGEHLRVAQAAAGAARAVELLEQHLADHGELLPSLYFDALGVWYLEAWRRGEPGEFAQARAVAAVLDAEFRRDPKVENATAVGFLEMFSYLPEREKPAAETLPPTLYAEYKTMAAWLPS